MIGLACGLWAVFYLGELNPPGLDANGSPSEGWITPGCNNQHRSDPIPAPSQKYHSISTHHVPILFDIILVVSWVEKSLHPHWSTAQCVSRVFAIDYPLPAHRFSGHKQHSIWLQIGSLSFFSVFLFMGYIFSKIPVKLMEVSQSGLYE